MDGWKTTFLLGWPIFRGHVSFRECKSFRFNASFDVFSSGPSDFHDPFTGENAKGLLVGKLPEPHQRFEGDLKEVYLICLDLI